MTTTTQAEGRDGYARWLRSRATDLRSIAARMNAEADELERGPSRRTPLGGQELRDAAVAVLADAGACASTDDRGVHYKLLREMIEQQRGRRIRGEKPAMTLLANIHRDERIECVQERSGRYRLAPSRSITAHYDDSTT